MPLIFLNIKISSFQTQEQDKLIQVLLDPEQLQSAQKQQKMLLHAVKHRLRSLRAWIKSVEDG